MIPISTTNIDWTTFLLTGKQATGHSISTILDNNGLRADNVHSFLITLGGLVDQIKPNLIEVGNALDHASVGFITVLDTETLIELMELASLKVYSVPLHRNDRLAIISGSLSHWRESIINSCSPNSSPELRLLLDKALLHLEKMGLGQIWGKYRKSMLPDKTFILT